MILREYGQWTQLGGVIWVYLEGWANGLVAVYEHSLGRLESNSIILAVEFDFFVCGRELCTVFFFFFFFLFVHTRMRPY